MPTPTATPDRRRALTAALAVAALVGLLDQLTKAWAFDTLRGEAPLVVWAGRLQFEFALNTGAAFGVGQDWSGARVALSTFALLVSIALVFGLWRWAAQSRWARLGVGLAVGGALSNAADRWHRFSPRRVYRTIDLHFDDLIRHGNEVAEAMSINRHWYEFEEYGVVDFIVVFVGGSRPWPAFNLADVALTLAVGCACVWAWRQPSPPPEAA